MKKSSKRVLVGLGIFFLVLLISVVGLFVYEFLRVKPNNVRFSNITSSSVTVSWNTEKAIVGTVRVFEGDTGLPVSVLGMDERFFDTRDVKEAELDAVSTPNENREEGDFSITIDDFNTEIEVNDMGNYYTHHVAVTGLDPETEYFFMVGDTLVFTKVRDIRGNSVATTEKVVESVKGPHPAYGTIKDAKNENTPFDELESVQDGVVYINYLDKNTGIKSNIFSSALNNEGNWYVDLSLATDIEGNDFLETYDTPDENVVVEITVDGGNVGTWQSRQYSYQISPVPDIVLNIPGSIQDLDIEGSVVPIDMEDVKGESTGIVAALVGPAAKKNCEESGLGTWNATSEKCICVRHASATATQICKCDSGYVRDGNSCVFQSGGTGKTCNSCTLPSCPSAYPDSGCSSGSCDSKVISCNKQYSDGSGKCGVRQKTCYKAKPAVKTLAYPPCAFHTYCSCVEKYTDGTYSNTNEAFDCTKDKCGASISTTAKERMCSYMLEEGEIQELLKCSGQPLESITYFGGVCKRCERKLQNGYYTARWVEAQDLTYNHEKNCCASRAGSCVTGQEVLECGDAHERSYASTLTVVPSGSLCKEPAQAKPRAVTFSEGVNSVSWKCELGGQSKNCSATRKKSIEEEGGQEAPECGDAYERSYASTLTVVPSGSLCNGSATPTPKIVRFYQNTKVFWKCELGGQSKNCWAIRKKSSEEEEEEKIEYCTESTTKPLYRNVGEDREKCVKGEWEPDPVNKKDDVYYDIECELGNSCTLEIFPRKRCVSSNNEILVCKSWKWKDDDEYEQAVIRDHITADKLCDNSNGCLCTSLVMSSEPIDEGDYCPKYDRLHCETLGSSSGYANTNGHICSRDSKKYICNKGECVLETEVQSTSSYLLQKRNDISIKDFIPVVYTSDNSYILDPESGYFQQLEPGLYTFEYENQIYTFTVQPWQETLMVYIDKNNNGEYDNGIDIQITEIASTINIIPSRKDYNYNLSKGFNFISFPYLITNFDTRTAASLLKKLNEVYGDSIYSISKFDSGRWKMVGQNVEVYDNNDFQLLPGEGYMIKAKRDIDISIVGQPVQFESESDKAPIYLSQGWNLIGLYGTKVKSYTAKSLIEDINVDNFTADNVTKWGKDKQMYEGFQLEGKEEYGFDYPLNKLESYFVRITEGKGNWQPSLSGNN